MSDWIKDLITQGLIDTENSIKIQDGVRDRQDVEVWKCLRSGVIYLKGEHLGDQLYYENLNGLEYSRREWNQYASQAEIEFKGDDHRRADQFSQYYINKDVVDFGCGAGGFLRLIKEKCNKSIGVELQEGYIDLLKKSNIVCKKEICEIDDNSIDTIFLFHVFEHLSDPVGVVRSLKKKLKKGGVFIVEVPHARDALITYFDSQPFKKFTFWSEHLVLHTTESLSGLISSAGFEVFKIERIQRYPLSNHLYWLASGKPGGHKIYDIFNSKELNEGYEDVLKMNDMTDTIVLHATI